MHFASGMMIPLQITFRNMDRSEVIEAAIGSRIARLSRLAPDLMRCAVVVERPHRQHRHGNLYQVTIHLTLPRGKVVVGTEADRDHAHEDVMVAITDAMRAARRAMIEWLRAHRDVAAEVPAPRL